MTPLCSANALDDGSAKGVQLERLSLIVLREGESFYVYENQCPHLGIPLEWLPDQFLDEEGELIRCATHGALFLKHTGDCVAGPCAGDRLKAVPCRVVDGMVCLVD